MDDGVVHAELEPEAFLRLPRQSPQVLRMTSAIAMITNATPSAENFESIGAPRDIASSVHHRREPHRRSASSEAMRGNTGASWTLTTRPLSESVVGGKIRDSAGSSSLDFCSAVVCVTTRVYQRALGDLEEGSR
jgi:hypothetical protein